MSVVKLYANLAKDIQYKTVLRFTKIDNLILLQKLTLLTVMESIETTKYIAQK